MYRRPLAVIFLLVAVATTLLAQSSPWPFPPRNASQPPASGGTSVAAAFWNIKLFSGGRPNVYKGE